MTYKLKLQKIIKKNNSFVCIGLDSNLNKIPKFLLENRYPQFSFNKAIIDATYKFVCAFKPNSAFYEVQGEYGILQLKMTFDYLREKYPQIPVILDVKRADIGESNDRYDRFAFEYLGADAITLHPYLGHEALEPFLKRKDKGCYILCRTSNKGAGEFQDLEINGKPLYQVVAKQVASVWDTNDNCGLVVGATYPEELKTVRKIAPNLELLIPGIGAQGGDLEKAVRYAADKVGSGFIISSSRGIIFAGSGEDFAKKAKIEAEKLRDQINMVRKITK
jgi:orotidine-5'-phosphate decarboxylase